jgi:hypothetical protein
MGFGKITGVPLRGGDEPVYGRFPVKKKHFGFTELLDDEKGFDAVFRNQQWSDFP